MPRTSKRLGRAFNPIEGIPSPITLRRPQQQPTWDPSDEQASPNEERAMRNLWLDGFFSECTEIIWLQFLALFAVAMGAGIGLVGVLTATTNLLAAISMWPGSILAERTRRYKAIVIVCGGVLNRVPFLLLAALPWITTGNLALAVIFGVCAMKGLFGSIAMPAWSAYCADFVPQGMRGRYLASRNFVLGCSSQRWLGRWSAASLSPGSGSSPCSSSPALDVC